MAPRVPWQPEYGPEEAGFLIAVIPPPSENGGFYIRVNKPELGRVGMHRAETYVNVPPGGTTQMEIVRQARGGECGDANTRLRTAMKLSIDYASLYSQIWSCYNISHQNHIYSVAMTGVEAYEEDLWRLEGDRSTAGYSSTPWAAPAPNGLDHRLEQWSRTEGEHSFPIVMLDLIGPDRAAMDLAGDLAITAEAAAAFARIESPNQKEIQFWARRVFVTSRALSQSPGEMIQEHQPETHNRIEALLDNATYGAYLGNPTKRLPGPVRSALLAGTGIQPVKVYPLGSKPVRPKPKSSAPPPEPVPEPEPEDCLLYTSPSPRDATLSRMPSSA